MIGLCQTLYKHGRTQFVPGTYYTVSDMLGGFLVGVNCLVPVDEVPAGAEHIEPALEELVSSAPPRKPEDGVTLSVDDVEHVASVPKVG